LQQLIVRSDGSGAGSAWHLDKVLIYPPDPRAPSTTSAVAATGASASAVAASSRGHDSSNLHDADTQHQQQFHEQPVYFIAQRWLDEDAGLEVVLPAAYSDPGQRLQAYHLEVYTSNIK
jgi:hypothetical protein